MAIMHIVLFSFKSTTTPAQIEDVCTRMLQLPQKCLHPTTQKPYVKGHGGGKNTSPEGMNGEFSHAFIAEFASEEDRKYYLEGDPAHLEFVGSLGDVVEGVRVVDFEPGKI